MRMFAYWSSQCGSCKQKANCTTGKERRVKRWEHEAVLDTMQKRIDNSRDKMKLRRCTVEHVFGTLKFWMGATHFTMKGLANVSTEISLHILAYNLRRVMAILGIAGMMKAIRLAGA